MSILISKDQNRNKICLHDSNAKRFAACNHLQYPLLRLHSEEAEHSVTHM